MSNRGKPRPALFRALGKLDPPSHVQIDGATYELAELLKHDSWAATAFYQGPTKKVVCKFNRQQSILGLPMRWLGHWLARREADHYRCLAEVSNVPALCGPVMVDGAALLYAVAHDYVEGRPLRRDDMLSEAFMTELREAFAEVHRRRMAYVDLHKRENILVGTDGKPYLIDFQVSYLAPETSGTLRHWFLRQLQAIDRYHLEKHARCLRANLGIASGAAPTLPWWIRAHRMVAVPLREVRRRLLVLLGIRKAKGRAHSEHFAEDAVRQEQQAA